jgi:hypothetical protein
MKLTAIVNAWADTIELLPFCLDNIGKMVDSTIVMWSKKSYRGVESDAVMEFMMNYKPKTDVRFQQLEPIKAAPHINEVRKRNQGLKEAYQDGATHFIMLDADEFYIKDQFVNEWARFHTNQDLNGIVCPLKVFLGKPTLWCEDHTLVPAIHKLQRNTEVGPFRKYPFAVNGGTARIDPTRRVNFTHGIVLSEMVMYHMSYVRKDMRMKIDNSAANLVKSTDMILNEMEQVRPGYFSRMYNKTVQECPNYFNISF